MTDSLTHISQNWSHKAVHFHIHVLSSIGTGSAVEISGTSLRTDDDLLWRNNSMLISH
jgi:hypothetical protein